MSGRLLGAVTGVLLVATGCSGGVGRETPQDAATEVAEATTAPPEATSTPTPTPTPTQSPTPAPTETPTPVAQPEPRRSFVTIGELGLRAFSVRRYQGSPDDAAGTAIQNGGDMASPRGPRGGVGPGEVGNFIVTGHRLSSTMPLRYSPSLERGDRIEVRSGDTVYVYEVRRTRWTSFRSQESLAAQLAPVPGRPGVDATQPMITLSTCATVEDHAAGNYWSDEFDNPEHRIDKIGVLVDSRPA
jgi:sortase A